MKALPTGQMNDIQNVLIPSAYKTLYLLVFVLALACSSKDGEVKDEQIRIENMASDTTLTDSTNSISGKLSLNQIATTPNTVILTGLPQHRLVTIYKSRSVNKTNDGYSSSDRYYYDGDENERYHHFMPGIDLIYGYNLLNIAHYDLMTEQLNNLFEHPVLIKSLYYPSFEQDSLDKKPINRNYYLVSAYDADTNSDTLINKKDLRRFYYFNASCTEKIQLVPADYSVVRSQYDAMNDVMYVFARHDENHNGATDKKEPMHIFWMNLKAPAKAKRMY